MRRTADVSRPGRGGLMDYGALIRWPWDVTWRHRWLWVLGLFAGGSAGTCSGSFGSPGGGDQSDEVTSPIPELDPLFQGLATWLADNVVVLVAIAVAAGLLGLLMVIISLFAQGGMARATIDLASGSPTSAGQAWAVGRRLCWRYLGMWLLLALVGLALLICIAVYVFLIFLLGFLTVGGVWAALLAFVLGLPLLLLIIAVAIVLSIVVAFAQRAIVDRDLGPLDALLAGWRLLRAHLGTGLLVWLLSVALSVAASIAMVLAMVAVLVVLGLPGVALWLTIGLAAPTVAYLVLVAVVVLAVLLLLTAIVNTYFWSFWTFAYLRLARAPAAQP